LEKNFGEKVGKTMAKKRQSKYKKEFYDFHMSWEEAWAILELLDMHTDKWPQDKRVADAHRRLEEMLVPKKNRDKRTGAV
jgi:hypothetical protein